MHIHHHHHHQQLKRKKKETMNLKEINGWDMAEFGGRNQKGDEISKKFPITMKMKTQHTKIYGIQLRKSL